MSDQDTLAWIEDIVREELDNDEISLAMNMSPADVEGWDSIAHVGIVVAVEKRLGRQFTVDQIDRLKNIGDLVRLAQQTQSA